MDFLAIKKILVLGLGKSGFTAAKLGKSKNFEVTVVDEAESELLFRRQHELEQYGINVYLGYKNSFLPHCDVIVISPGISEHSFLGSLARKTGVKIISEIDFAAYYVSKPIIAITGTNGKTTVTELCTYVLNNLGKKAVSAGNIGVPLSIIANDEINYDFIVLEISSFQLHYCIDFKPYIAAILNIESDHIDWHCSFQEYANDKLKIGANQSSNDFIVINESLMPLVKNNKHKLPGTLKRISLNSRSAFLHTADGSIILGGSKLYPINALETMGKYPHNIENSLACIAICEILGFPLGEILKSFHGFKTGEHRLEFVDMKNGVKFVNDSKSTNPSSIVAALEAVGGERNVCLIVGGLDKDMDFSPVVQYKNRIKKIFITGKSKNKLGNLFKSIIDHDIFDSFEQTIYAACNYAENGDVVLLSPGCASMDMFENYIERGNFFKKIVKRRCFEDEGA